MKNSSISVGVLLACAPGLWCQPVAGAGNTFNVTQYGATGKRDSNSTKAIQAAIDACTTAGGGVVYVPPGEYTTGAVPMEGVLRNLRASEGTGTFLEFRGSKIKDLWVHTSNLKKAARPAAFADGAQPNSVMLQ